MKFMKNKKFRIITIVIVVVIVVGIGGMVGGLAAYRARTYDDMTARFYVSRVFEEGESYTPGIIFSMLSEDGRRIMHIDENMPIRFEDSTRFQRAGNITYQVIYEL